MRVGCVICSDSFGVFGDVAAVPCGHTFHTHCLLQWIENSKSCPTCRQKTTARNVTRLFFDSTGADDSQVDKDSLQNQIDNLKFKVVEKDQIINSLREENLNLEKQSSGLRREVIKFEKMVKEKETTILAYKEQMRHLENVVKTASKAEEESRNAKSELRLLRQIKMLIEDNSEEIEEMILSNSTSLNSTESIKNLSTMCSILKSRVSKLQEEKRRYGVENHALMSKLKETNKERLQSNEKMVELQKEVSLQREDVKSLERENQSLQKKISCLEQAVASPSADSRNSAIHRLIYESPAPVQLKRNMNESQFINITPEIVRKAPLTTSQNIEESSGHTSQDEVEVSPYLQLKSSSLINFSSAVKPNENRLKKEYSWREKPQGIKSPHKKMFGASEEGYNGLGGHHQVPCFPVPRPGLNKKKARSSKIAGSITHISSRSIKDYFKDPFTDF